MRDPMTEWAGHVTDALFAATRREKYIPPSKLNRTTSAKKHKAKAAKQQSRAQQRDVQAQKSKNARKK